MKEFGSDFHYVSNYVSHTRNEECEYSFYANGRQALQDIILNSAWKRIWVPTYFCYEVISSIQETGITVISYNDAPSFDDNSIISKIPFLKNDVLLRMNFFGLRTWRNNNAIPVDVIEDHSHDLYSDWAKNSNANWCIASIRKTIPIPEGGIAWSPKKHPLPPKLSSTQKNEALSYKRLSAMLLKSLYLLDENIKKNQFLKLFRETEEEFNMMERSSISEISYDTFSNFNKELFYRNKVENWLLLTSIVKHPSVEILEPEKIKECNPFSLVLKFNNSSQRESCKKLLIKNDVYPATLWQIPNEKSMNLGSISDTLLSIHCDARYIKEDIHHLGGIINKSFD